MRVINLCAGEGDGKKTACLMTASNMLIGKPENGDKSSCVCPLLRSFILVTNDAMPDAIRNILYGPLVWEIVGTRNNNNDVLRARLEALARWAFFDVTIPLLRKLGVKSPLDRLDESSSFPEMSAAASEVLAPKPIASHITDSWVWTPGDTCLSRNWEDCELMAYQTVTEARLVAVTANCSVRNAPGFIIERAMEGAAYNAGHAIINAACVDGSYWEKCPEIIRRIAAIGDRRPVERVISLDELADCLDEGVATLTKEESNASNQSLCR